MSGQKIVLIKNVLIHTLCLVFVNIIDIKAQAICSFSGLKPSLNSPYHTSEGVVMNLGRDTLLNIFRLDTANFHIQNDALVVQRYSYDGGKNWTLPEIIYNSPYDDRNISGGIINGRISIILRRLDFSGGKGKVIDVGRIYSDDRGKTWSEYLEFKFDGFHSAQPFGELVRMGDGTWNVILNRGGIVYLLSTNDGDKYQIKSTITTYMYADETSVAYIGSNKVIALTRDESEEDSTYLFLRSNNNGKDWYYISRTKMNSAKLNVSRTAPYVVWDSLNNAVIAISTQRHIGNPKHNLKSNALVDSIFIYSATPENAYSNNWDLVAATLRPEPNSWPLYGYPTMTQLKNGSWVGIITERSKRNETDQSLISGIPEFAHLYQFYLNCTKKKIKKSNSK